MNKLFDIASTDALSLIKIPADRDFLIDQRGDGKMVMDAIDKVDAEKKKKNVSKMD